MNKLEHRNYWVSTMIKIVEPVLTNLSEGKLKEKMPVVFFGDDRTQYAHLEAFGRAACGIAPWLELDRLVGEEEKQRAYFEKLMLKALDAATDPASADYMNFDVGSQPLVDTAFLSHAILRAPSHIAAKLDGRVLQNVITALKKSRKIIPGGNNWLLFSAMVEAALSVLGSEDFDFMRIDYAVRQFMQWYVGDGVYGDGPDFHADYYNSFVIQPMLVDLARMFYKDSSIYTEIITRAGRYASQLEMMISPNGAYTVIGRSSTYRFGAFQLLSQAALQGFLEQKLLPAQVRCALTAVIERIMQFKDNFDDKGWLRHGICGYQPDLAETYICTGSLYLCSSVFLVLGLPSENEFWSGENKEWTSQKIFSGKNILADKSIGH